MGKDINVIDEINLHNTAEGKIEIATIDKPYGPNSDMVVSIGIFLKNSNEKPDWKVHIPIDNLDSVIESLNKIKESIK